MSHTKPEEIAKPEPAPKPIDIDETLSSMRDSVWVIENELSNNRLSKKDLVSRNVSHLKLMVEVPEIRDSGQNLSDINAAIEAGESYLSSLES